MAVILDSSINYLNEKYPGECAVKRVLTNVFYSLFNSLTLYILNGI